MVEHVHFLMYYYIGFQTGELLFVPGGSPHYVENLSATLAVSSNHVDHSNFKEVFLYTPSNSEKNYFNNCYLQKSS